MPWWVGVALAIGGYGLLHHWAGKPMNVKSRAFKVGVDVVRELYRVMAARGATGGSVLSWHPASRMNVDFVVISSQDAA